MGGCLGPRQRKQQVYIEVIQSIHEQAQHMSLTRQEYINRSGQNMDIYTLMKQKLSKKGLLRKLIDNLVSHRAKIYDSLNHNYQIVLQSNHIENKYAGLLIIDQVIQGIYHSLRMSSQSIDNNNGNKVQGSDNYSSLANSYNKNNNNNGNINQRAQRNLHQSLQKWFVESKKLRHSNSRKYDMAVQSNPLLREIDSRFDMLYFSLVIYLLENVPRMYTRVLKSINSYCLNKKGKFLCTQAVWTTIHFIMSRIIKLQQQVKQNVFSYMLLLQNTKENFKQYQKPQDLKLFIDLWIREVVNTEGQKISRQQQRKMKLEDESMGKIGASDNDDSMHQYQQQQQYIHTTQSKPQSTSTTNQHYINNLLKIISLYFHTNISTWNSNFLYDVMLDIYDQYMFQSDKVLKFESVIFTIIQENELHVQFFRGLFLLLLDYLGYKHCVRGSRVQPSVSMLGGEVSEIKWANCDKKQVKLNALRTLRRWVVNKHIDLNQTVSYNCRLLFQAYLTNYSLNDTHFNIQVSKQFLKLIRENLTLKSKIIVINTIVESIREEDTDSRVRSVLIGLLRELLEDRVLVGGEEEGDQDGQMEGISRRDSSAAIDVMICIEEYYPNQNKLQLVQLMGFVIQSLPITYFNFQPYTTLHPINNQTISNSSLYITTFKHKLSQFIYSCYHTLIQSQQNDLLFMLRFTCSLLSFIKEIYLNKKSSLGIVYAFYRQLVKILVSNTNDGKIEGKMSLQLSPQQYRQSPNTNIKRSPTFSIKQSPLIPSYNTLINRYFILYLTYELGHLLHQSISIPQQFSVINQRISSSQTVTHGMLGTFKSSIIHQNKKQQIYSMIDKLQQRSQYSSYSSSYEQQQQRLKQLLGYRIIEQQLQQHILPQRQNYQQTQNILSSYFTKYCERTKRNIMSTNQEEDRGGQEVVGNNGNNNSNRNATTMQGNLFSRKDSVFNQSESGSYYRQEDKNLKDVLSIINC